MMLNGPKHSFLKNRKINRQAIKAYGSPWLLPSWSDWVDNFIGNLYFEYEEYDSAEQSDGRWRKSGYNIYRENLG